MLREQNTIDNNEFRRWFMHERRVTTWTYRFAGLKVLIDKMLVPTTRLKNFYYVIGEKSFLNEIQAISDSFTISNKFLSNNSHCTASYQLIVATLNFNLHLSTCKSFKNSIFSWLRTEGKNLEHYFCKGVERWWKVHFPVSAFARAHKLQRLVDVFVQKVPHVLRFFLSLSMLW